jgi:hypothetical protein
MGTNVGGIASICVRGEGVYLGVDFKGECAVEERERVGCWFIGWIVD